MAARPAKPPELDSSMRVVVLHGQDAFQMPERTRRLAESLTEAHGEIQTFRFDGASAEPAVILDELRSYALMQTHKLVIVDNAEQFLAREGHRPIMERYVESPVEHATLLLLAPTWRSGKIDKLIAKVGAVVKISDPTRAQAVSWSVARCRKEHDAELARPAAELLVERCGPELARLDAELAKLATYAGSGATVDRGLVEELVGMTREEEAWALQSVILSGDPGTAVRKLRELTQVSRHADTLLMWAVCDLLRKLHGSARMLRDGAAPGTISKRMRLWGEMQRLVLAAARHLDPDRMAQLLQDAVNADVRTKTGVGDSGRTLEALTVSVADTVGSACRG